MFLAPLGTLQAASRQQQDPKASTVPESAMPPAGMCRVWLKDVPERQQPAPTDCVSAIRSVPRDAMVLFGDLKRSAKVGSPNTALPPTTKAQQSARDLPGYRGPGVLTGVTATAAGGAVAASKAPEPKAVIKPEKPQ